MLIKAYVNSLSVTIAAEAQRITAIMVGSTTSESSRN